MIGNGPQLIELVEYVPKELERDELPEAAALSIVDHHSAQVAVEHPWHKTGHRWRLTSQGWVGHIPISSDLHLVLQPKVPLGNLFLMLEYAYKVGTFGPGLVDCASLQELYERLALVLSRRVLDRGRKGLYRAYVGLEERTPFVRGRLSLRQVVRAPWDTRIHCQFEEHTADVEDNQILTWTLFLVVRSGVCTDRSLATVRQAYRTLQHCTSLRQTGPESCLARPYHRLNEDYRPLHALCRFFLENSGPAYRAGDRKVLPFLVDMARLFEVFVAEWLKAHPIPGLRLKPHHRMVLDQAGTLRFDIDLLLTDAQTGQPLYILDTKYKNSGSVDHGDLSQVVTYAEAMGCREAVLVYPAELPVPLNVTIGDIHVRTLAYALDGDLEQAGQSFVRHLLQLSNVI